MAHAFPGDATARNPMELVMDERNQLLERALVAVPPPEQ
jgi:hypothetical protein